MIRPRPHITLFHVAPLFLTLVAAFAAPLFFGRYGVWIGLLSFFAAFVLAFFVLLFASSALALWLWCHCRIRAVRYEAACHLLTMPEDLANDIQQQVDLEWAEWEREMQKEEASVWPPPPRNADRN